eukprot:2615552-Rhodomonas_salina.1
MCTHRCYNVPIATWEGAIAKWEGAIAKWEGAIAKWEGAPAKWEGAIAKWEGAPAKWEGAIAKWEGAIAKWEGAIAKWDDVCTQLWRLQIAARRDKRAAGHVRHALSDLAMMELRSETGAVVSEEGARKEQEAQSPEVPPARLFLS